MSDYDALRAAWKVIPVDVTGDALTDQMTTEEKLATVQKWTITIQKPIQAVEIRKFFIKSGILTEALFFSQDTNNDLTLRKLCRTVYDALALNAFDNLDPNDPEQGPQITAFLDGLQAAKCLSDEQRAAVLALGQIQVPWWQSKGFLEPIGTADLTLAGGLS